MARYIDCTADRMARLIDEAPLDHQEMAWRERTRLGVAHLNEDASTRARLVLTNGIPLRSLRFLQGRPPGARRA